MKLLMLLVIFFSVESSAYEKIRDRTPVACDGVLGQLLKKTNSDLEQAYYLSNVVFCNRHYDSKYKKLGRGEWFTSGYYLRNISKVNNLISIANYSLEEIELIDELKNKFYLTPANSEVIRKALLEKLKIDSDYYNSDEHPYEKYVVTERLYSEMASIYYEAGMKADGERILNELRQLPHQDIPGIDKKQKIFEGFYGQWKENQESNVEIDKQSNINKTAEVVSELKVADDASIKEAKDAAVDTKADEIEPESPINKYGLFILALFVVFIWFMCRRRRNKN